jgi:hypothetical protein
MPSRPRQTPNAAAASLAQPNRWLLIASASLVVAWVAFLLVMAIYY